MTAFLKPRENISELVVLNGLLFLPLQRAIALAITKAREQDVPVKIKQASEHSRPHSCIAFWTNESTVSGEIGACASPAIDFSLYDFEWRLNLRNQSEALGAQKLFSSVAFKSWTCLCWKTSLQLH